MEFILVQESLENFAWKINKIDTSPIFIERLAEQVIGINNLKFMEILINEFNFCPSEKFFENCLSRPPIMYDMMKLIYDLTGINIFDLMNKKSVDAYVLHMIKLENKQHQNGLLNIFIASKININVYRLSTYYLSYVNESNKHIFEYLMDNGMRFNISDKDYNFVEVLCGNDSAIELLMKYEFDFTIINKNKESRHFNKFKKSHQLLIDLGVDPIAISYSLKRDNE